MMKDYREPETHMLRWGHENPLSDLTPPVIIGLASEKMAPKKPPKSSSPDIVPVEKLLRERKRFSRFSSSDAKLLAGLRGTFSAHASEIVEQFYQHLLAFEPLRPLLADPDMVNRLKKLQEGYLISLTAGKYGKSYVTNRLQMGRRHEKVGLHPQWYLGTYCLYLDLLIPLVIRHYRGDKEKTTRACIALTKLMNLDAQFVLEAYFETRHQKAIERSEHLAAVGELAASIAHEVRNPLAGMKGALEVLRKDLGSDSSRREIMDEVMAQIERLETLVRDLLSYARPRPLDLKPMDLQALLERVLRLVQEGLQSFGITLRCNFDSAPRQIVADSEQLEQVFLNLTHNAIHSMEDGGTLTLSIQETRKVVRIIFQDTGKGIPPVDLPRIFQPFFTTKHRGSGLGLPIVQKIVEAHDGTISVVSDSTHGTLVTLELPKRRTG